MRHVAKAALLAAIVVLIPNLAQAQSLAGTVRDASNAVLPGVTVEAASPALIEKVRTTVSDGTGLYRIQGLTPGIYKLTFTLPGFTTVIREGVEVSGGASNITINAEMRVGGVQETITVTGETPVVDVQTSTRTQKVIDNEVIAAIPASRGYGNILATVPGIQATGLNSGANPVMNFFTARGGRGNEGTVQIDGMNVGSAFNGGGVAGFGYDTANAQEIQVTIAGGLGETDRGGPAFNMIPRTGGNNFSGTYFLSYAGEWAQSSNLDDELRSYGINEVPGLIKNYDTNFAMGGPIVRDKLWFFGNARTFGSASLVPGLYANANAGNPNAFTYVADPSVQSRSANSKLIGAMRLTNQLTPRNKLGFLLRLSEELLGLGLRQGRGPVSRSWRRLDCARRHRRLRIELGGSGQPGVGRPREDRAGHVVFAGDQPPASRGWALLLHKADGASIRAGATRASSRSPSSSTPGERRSGTRTSPTARRRIRSATTSKHNVWRASASLVSGSHSTKIGYQAAYQVQKQFNDRKPNMISYTSWAVHRRASRSTSPASSATARASTRSTSRISGR
jgi:hypothetical protein